MTLGLRVLDYVVLLDGLLSAPGVLTDRISIGPKKSADKSNNGNPSQ
jgi:hypothetical protein